MKELLVVENLSIDYGEGEKLSNLNFSISEKTLNAILCPNNCGKTSLIKTLSGINSQFEGRISVNGTVLSKKEFKKYILNVGVVTEDIDLMFITDIVRDELEFPMINLFYPKEEINSRIKKISKIVKIENILEKNIEELSLVEKIKVLIATSIMHIPKILLLDDIFRLLVESEKKEILKILNKIVKDLEMAVTKASLTVIFLL